RSMLRHHPISSLFPYTTLFRSAETRWGGQIAPPMVNIAVRKELLADPVPREQRRPSFRGIHVFVSGTTTHWYRPVLDGDTLYGLDRKSTRLNSSHVNISYAVFC